jgi:DNA-binding GntR family transcriptional regulator
MKRARRLDFPLPPRTRLTRPLWRSLEAVVAWQIDIGRVASGSRVPSTRTIARQLGISRTTVAEAFDSLTARGYFAARVGDGTYVLQLRHRTRPAVWQQPRHWIRDPDGLLVWVITPA